MTFANLGEDNPQEALGVEEPGEQEAPAGHGDKIKSA